MYRIGEFSKLTGITVKTLRYYHELDLIIPVQIDEETGYRHYDDACYQKAKRIQLLKNYSFSLTEIQEILQHWEDSTDLQAYLQEKHLQMETQVARIRKEQEKILKAIQNKEVMPMAKTSAVTIKEVPDIKVASIRYKGRYDEMGHYIGELFKVVKGSAAGPITALYHDECYKEDDADIEVCVPVKKEVSGKDITTKILAGGRYATAIHTGPYNLLSDSYKVLMDYMTENGLRSEIPSREIYLKGPGMLLKGNPEKYETELQMKIL